MGRLIAFWILLVTCVQSAAQDPPRDFSRQSRFDPASWLKAQRLGPLQTRTPQSGKPLQPLSARSLVAWKRERESYRSALWELLGPWPRKRPPLQPRVIQSIREEGWTRHKVGFRSLASGEPLLSEIRAWLFVPDTAKASAPAIVTLHQTVPQGKDEPAGLETTVPWMDMARHFAKQGYVTLAPDMIGYGERMIGGTAATGFEWADAEPLLRKQPKLTLLSLMLFDVSRCVDYLRTRKEVDPKRIGVIGHSQGGFLTNLALAVEPRFAAGAASCGYGLFRHDELFPERWAAFNSANLPRLSLYKGKASDLPLDFLQILALAAPKPHLVQTAMGDTIWTKPAVARDPFVCAELRRIQALYSREAADNFVSIEPIGGATDRDHGWYPEGIAAADRFFAKVLRHKVGVGNGS